MRMGLDSVLEKEKKTRYYR